MATKTKKPGRRQSMAVDLVDLAAIEHKNAFTKVEFCARNGISIPTFNNWDRDGIGPAVMKGAPGRGGKVLISREAEAEWQRKMEARPRIGRPPRNPAGRPPADARRS